MSEESKSSKLLVASERYSDLYIARAAVQAIPVIGSVLDVMLAGPGSSYRQDRIDAFINDLKIRMQTIEGEVSDKDHVPLSDLVLMAMKEVANTRSEKKRDRLSAIVANQVTKPREWDEAEAAMRLVSEFSDLHIDVLMAFQNAPDTMRHGKGVLTPGLQPEPDAHKQVWGTPLRNMLPQYTPDAILFACHELLARGMIKDVGVGTFDGVSSMVRLEKTELTDWFLKWIASN